MKTNLITLTEAAARMNPPCSAITLLRRVQKDPSLPQPLKLAGRWFFEESELLAHSRENAA